MLTVSHPASTRSCDGVSRRDFVRAGVLGATGLSLPVLFRAQAAAGPAGFVKEKSVIFLFLAGGPSQYETFDPKMTARRANPQRHRRNRHPAAGRHVCRHVSADGPACRGSTIMAAAGTGAGFVPWSWQVADCAQARSSGNRRNGDVPNTDPITIRDLMATITHTIFDVGQLPAGPVAAQIIRLTETGRPIEQLVG